MTPTFRRQVVGALKDEHNGWSERRVCSVLGWSRTSVRYQASAAATLATQSQARLKQLATDKVAWGYRRLFRLWKSEFPTLGWRRFRRLYVSLGLGHSRPRRRRVLPRPTRPTLPRATAARQSYAIDFMHHRTVRGVVFRILVAVDEYTRELLCMKVSRSFTTSNVARQLDEIFAEYGTPNQVRSDNGPEFVSKSFQQWLRARGVQQVLSRPGKPCDNGLCESTNGRIRDELLRPELFTTIEEAEDAAARFREEYNTIRPHSALDGLSPSAYYQRLAPPTFEVE